ncbi:MAG: deoxyribodipyrimidine photolyase [Gemmataceae bacterium]
MNSEDPAIVWFRQDLRLADNPALLAAVGHGGPVIAVYVWSPDEEGNWPPGAASKWWLHQSLAQLDRSLRRYRSRLVLRQGPALKVLRELVQETRATAVYWNRRYEPAAMSRDARVESALRCDGIRVGIYNASLLFEPWTVSSPSGRPYCVFTPFWAACVVQAEPARPVEAPARLPAPRTWPASLALTDLALEPTVDWAGGLRASWQPGEVGAARQLECFIEEVLRHYPTIRDRPDLVGTSRLSPHLHFGEISPRQVWHALRNALGAKKDGSYAKAVECYSRQLGWREFAYYLLYHFPHTADEPLKESFRRFPWRTEARWLRAWQRGRTGYPIVDAGMRQLWHTGWMHNRVRMVVASFLVKDLLISWREGAAWFWDTLVDADLANNTLGWQWAAGCGSDAVPYFRIFNPVRQGERFDPNGDYVRRWVPELARLPIRWLHRPWEAPASVLREAGIELGVTYPRPIVDHSLARQRALEALQKMRL